MASLRRIAAHGVVDPSRARRVGWGDL